MDDIAIALALHVLFLPRLFTYHCDVPPGSAES
jgi:hypothetical protein